MELLLKRDLPRGIVYNLGAREKGVEERPCPLAMVALPGNVMCWLGCVPVAHG